MTNISFAIMTCNEDLELFNLLDMLSKTIKKGDEIVLLTDKSNTTKKVYDVIKIYEQAYQLPIVHIERELNKDFASQKNFLFDSCTKEFIFNLDADELPSKHLMSGLHKILSENDVDVFVLPRQNIVTDITDDYIKSVGWKTSHPDNRINWPDPQQRIVRNIKTEDNKSTIRWDGVVHERLIGFESHTFFPLSDEFAIIHIKKFDKQLKQNEFYAEIINNNG